ncbi:hypothetical protein PIB30_004774 [Stylosanthes scabra]|uniref:Uncharacterized protein n=1 Tax=Stylosanthes scabra TaxID=79078 RepID=A0ABU6T4I7_9FABA|nr:hypothetical protein [Stylosanthes scabra]
MRGKRRKHVAIYIKCNRAIGTSFKYVKFIIDEYINLIFPIIVLILLHHSFHQVFKIIVQKSVPKFLMAYKYDRNVHCDLHTRTNEMNTYISLSIYTKNL